VKAMPAVVLEEASPKEMKRSKCGRHTTNTLPFREISRSHGDEYEDDGLLGCCAVYSGRN
jgi:hypothetical protein